MQPASLILKRVQQETQNVRYADEYAGCEVLSDLFVRVYLNGGVPDTPNKPTGFVMYTQQFSEMNLCKGNRIRFKRRGLRFEIPPSHSGDMNQSFELITDVEILKSDNVVVLRPRMK